MYDDGHMLLQLVTRLTPREKAIAYGLAEKAFSEGRRNMGGLWERCRKRKGRAQGYYRAHFSVRADGDHPMTQAVALAAAGLDPNDLEQAGVTSTADEHSH